MARFPSLNDRRNIYLLYPSISYVHLSPILDYQIYYRPIMLQNKQTDSTKFTLPNGITTSVQELKGLEQKLLQNYYQANSPLKFNKNTPKSISTERSTNSNIKFNPSEFQSQRRLNQYVNEGLLAQRGIRNNLSDELEKQIQRKNMKKMLQKHDILSEEKHLISNTINLDSLEKERQLQFQQKYQAEAQEHVKVKQHYDRQKHAQKTDQLEYYHNKYNSEEMTRSRSVGKLLWQLNPTKQYYYEIDSAIRERNKLNSLNPQPQAFSRSRSFKKPGSSEQTNETPIFENNKSSYLRQQAYVQEMKQREVRQRQDLKLALMSQMRDKQEAKRQERIYERQVPYVTGDYKQMHHPIYNPINFKYAHDNKPLLNQLKSLQ